MVTGFVSTFAIAKPHAAEGSNEDGFVEYGRQTVEGLINQGWKDSHDSVRTIIR